MTLTTLGQFDLSKTSILGYLEKRAIHAKKGTSWTFQLVIVPPKSIYVSSLGSRQFTKGCHFAAGNMDFRFFPISVHGLQFPALLKISRCK